jgi:hypothetical protein
MMYTWKSLIHNLAFNSSALPCSLHTTYRSIATIHQASPTQQRNSERTTYSLPLDSPFFPVRTMLSMLAQTKLFGRIGTFARNADKPGTASASASAFATDGPAKQPTGPIFFGPHKPNNRMKRKANAAFRAATRVVALWWRTRASASARAAIAAAKTHVIKRRERRARFADTRAAVKAARTAATARRLAAAFGAAIAAKAVAAQNASARAPLCGLQKHNLAKSAISRRTIPVRKAFAKAGMAAARCASALAPPRVLLKRRNAALAAAADRAVDRAAADAALTAAADRADDRAAAGDRTPAASSAAVASSPTVAGRAAAANGPLRAEVRTAVITTVVSCTTALTYRGRRPGRSLRGTAVCTTHMTLLYNF